MRMSLAHATLAHLVTHTHTVCLDHYFETSVSVGTLSIIAIIVNDTQATDEQQQQQQRSTSIQLNGK